MPDAINTLAPYNHPVICDDDIYYDCIDFLPESGETAAAPALSQQCKDALLEAVKMISFAEAQVASLATLDALLKKLGLALPLHQLNVILAARQAYRQGLDISHAFSLALPALSWLQPEIIQDFALTIKNKMEEWLGESCACYLQQTQYGDRAGAVSFFLAILFLAMHYGASAATENQAETRLIKGTRWFLSLFYNVRHIWSLIAGLAETKQTASRIDDEGNIALSSQEKSVQKQEKAARKQAVIAGSLNQQQAEAAFTHHQPPVMATPPVQHAESAQAVQPEGSRFSAPVTWLDNLWRNHLTLLGVSAGVISGNPSTPDLSQFLQLVTDAATVSGESVMRATEATTLSDIRFNLSAITTFQHYYQQQWPDMISYAATLLQQAVKETFDVELDPENTWLHAFLLGSNADTLTGFEHVGKPAWSRKVVTLVITGFLPEEYENEIGLKGLYGVYKQSADQASHFGKNNEAGITPAQLMDVISSLNFYQRYTEKLEEFWKTPKVQELENIINFILQAAHHFHQVTPEDQAVFFKGWGLAQNKQPEVSRHLLRFKEYYATEIIIFRHPDSPKIYLYDPRGDSPFMIFPGEFEMKSWFINRCAGEEERQKIARAFSVYDRRWGLEEGLEKVGDPQADPNDFLDDFSFTKQPVQGDLAEAMAKRQKERAWSDAENIIKKKSAIIVERLELWLQACNKVIFNPLTPVIELGIEISKIIDADSWQARKAAATRVATNATLLLLTGAVGFIEKYLVENTIEPELLADINISESIAYERDLLIDDYRQVSLAQIMGLKRLPPELNIHNQPLAFSETLKHKIRLVNIKPAALETELLGPPEENGLCRGLTPETKDKKYVLVDNKPYEVSYNKEKKEYNFAGNHVERLSFIIDKKNKLAVEKVRLNYKVQEGELLNTHCRTKRSPASACKLWVDINAREALEKNSDKAIPAEEVENKLDTYDISKSLYKNKDNGRLYFKYKNKFFRAKISLTEENLEKITLKLKKETLVNKILRRIEKNYLDLYVIERAGGNKKTLTLEEDIPRVRGGHSLEGYELYKNYAGRSFPLTAEEYEALEEYGKTSSNTIKSVMAEMRLRGAASSQDAQSVLKTVDFIKSAINKIPPYQGSVYHGGSIKTKLLDELRIGDFVTNAAFISTSADQKVAAGFIPYGRYVSPGCEGIMLKLEIKDAGHPIMFYTFKPNEYEVLINDGTIFRVTELPGEIKRITLQEVDPQSVPEGSKVYYLDDQWASRQKEPGFYYHKGEN